MVPLLFLPTVAGLWNYLFDSEWNDECAGTGLTHAFTIILFY